MAKKIQSPNDSIQQQSTVFQSTRSGDRGSLETSTFGVSRKFLNSGASIGGGTYKSYVMDHIERMHADIEQTTRKLELEQRRHYKLDKELSSAEAEYAQKRERYIHYQNPLDDAVHHKAQQKRMLVQRLQKAIADLNKGTCENEQLQEKIDQLRRQRQILDTVFKQLEKGIKEKGKAITRVKQCMHEDRISHEEAKQKQCALNKLLERERKQFQRDCERLGEEVRKESEVHKEQEKLTRAGDGSARGSNGRNTNKRPYMVADEEEAFSEQLMHRRILKLSFLNSIQRRHIRQHQKNIEVFEQAFATIKQSTGIHEIEEIVKIFVVLEERNFSLLTYVNQLNREIEAIEIQNQELQKRLEDHKQEQKDSDERKDASLKDLVQQIDKTRSATQEKDRMIEEAAASLQECKPVIWGIVRYLRQEMPALISAGYEGDIPPTKIPPPDEHEENLNRFLMYIEEMVMQFRVCLSQEALRKQEMPPSKPPGGAAGVAGMKKPSELPSAHITGDDSDDDPETGLGERPLSRTELRERAQLMIQRRRKKPGQAGKVAHEQRPGAEGVADDSGGPLFCETTTKKDMGPPLQRSGSKDSKDEGGPGGGAPACKSPSHLPQSEEDGLGTAGNGTAYSDDRAWRAGKEKRK